MDGEKGFTRNKEKTKIIVTNDKKLWRAMISYALRRYDKEDVFCYHSYAT